MTQRGSVRGGIEPSLADWWEIYRRERQRADEHRVRVFLRSIAPRPGQHGRQRHLVSELQSAADASLIDGYEVTVVGNRICCCEHCRTMAGAKRIRETIDGLRRWKHGEITASGFEERSIDSSIAGEQYRVIAVPALSLGIYLDGSLSGVFPCQEGGVTHRPGEYLEMAFDQHVEGNLDAETGRSF